MSQFWFNSGGQLIVDSGGHPILCATCPCTPPRPASGLYVGGKFTTAGGAGVGYVSMWDGANWNVLGTGMNDFVFGLGYDSTLELVFAGGQFTVADGVSANSIAQWDGVVWSQVGGGLNNNVECILSNGAGSVYVGGYFTNAGGSGADYITLWNGSGFSKLGSGYPGGVAIISMCFNGSALLTLDINGVAYSFSSGVWTSLGGIGPSGGGSSIIVYASGIYAGQPSTSVSTGVRKWISGTTWTNVSGIINGTICDSLLISGSNLVAMGQFTFPGDNLHGVGFFNGSSWTFAGSSSTPAGGPLALFSGNVYGGGLPASGGSNYVAQFASGTSWTALGSGVNGEVDCFVGV